jgi:Big-like domain-containing protein
VKTIRQVGRDALARALRGYVLVLSRLRQCARQALGAFALASAVLVLSPGLAQAQTATTTTVVSSPDPSVAGQAVTFTATVSPAVGSPPPIGTVTFFDGMTQIGTGTLSSNGTVSTAVTAVGLAVGSHTITASYPGNTDSAPSSGSTTQTVNKNDTTTQIASSVNPSAATQSVTFSAVISPVTPTAAGIAPTGGTITFFDGGNTLGTGTLLGNGQAVFSTSNLALGNHTITTTYTGDANFNGSNGSLTGNPQVVNKGATTLSLTSSLNPSASGQSVTFTATVSPTAFGTTATPGGTVTFLDGGNQIGTGTLVPSGTGGQATFTTSALAVGNHTITASYPGDGNFSSSNGSLNSNPQVVNPPVAVNTSLAIAASPSGITVAQSVTFTVTITAASGTTSPTGTVRFSDGFGTIGSPRPAQAVAVNPPRP